MLLVQVKAKVERKRFCINFLAFETLIIQVTNNYLINEEL